MGGLFDAAGIEVEAVRTRSSTEQRAGLMDGTYDLGLTAIDNLIAWDADGDDLVVVAQVERTTVLDLCAAPEVGVSSSSAAARLPSTRSTPVSLSSCATSSRPTASRQTTTSCCPPDRAAHGGDRRGPGAAAGLLGPPFNQIAIARGCRVLAHAHEEVPGFRGSAR